MSLQNQKQMKVQFDFHALGIENALKQKELSGLLGIK